MATAECPECQTRPLFTEEEQERGICDRCWLENAVEALAQLSDGGDVGIEEKEVPERAGVVRLT